MGENGSDGVRKIDKVNFLLDLDNHIFYGCRLLGI